jgi:hypothetical protein
MASILVSSHNHINLYSNFLIIYLGSNQAELIMKVINSYGIASKVGYFMMDNASNNDTMMEALSICMYSLFKTYIYLLIY